LEDRILGNEDIFDLIRNLGDLIGSA